MKRRIAIVLALVMLFSLALTGCGTSSEKEVKTSSEKEVKTSNEKVELKFATWAGAQELKELQEIVDRLNSQSKEYKIEVMSIPSDYYVKIQTMIAGGTAPDLIWLSQEYIPAYASMGAILDITKYAQEDKSLDLSDFYDATLATAKFEDKLYGYPWISQPVIMYYNKKLFDEANIPYPTDDMTWEEFIEVGKKLTKDTNGDGKVDQYGFIVNGWPPIHLWLWTHGGDIIDNEGKVVIDSKESIEGIKVLNDIINVHKITPSRAQIEAQGFGEQFKTGKIAMFMGGAADDFEKTIKDFEVGTAPIPHGVKKATFNWIASTVISSQTKNKEVAYKALRDLTKAFLDWKVVPPVKSKVDDIVKIRPDKKNAIPTIRKSMEFGRGFNNQIKQAEIDSIVWDNLYDPILRGEAKPEEAAKKTADKLRKLLGQ